MKGILQHADLVVTLAVFDGKRRFSITGEPLNGIGDRYYLDVPVTR